MNEISLRIGAIIRPLTSRFSARFRGHTLENDGHEAIELAPGCSRSKLGVISLPGELDKVTGFAEDSTLESQMEIISAGTIQYGPTLGWKLQNVIVSDGALYTKTAYDLTRPRQNPLYRVPKQVPQFDSGFLCTHSDAQKYFAHWAFDTLPMEILATEMSETPVDTIRKKWIHEDGYREMVGTEPLSIDCAHFSSLWWVNDVQLNDNKLARLRTMRQRVRKSTVFDGPHRVFIARGQSGSARRLLNEPELMAKLTDAGFAVLDPEKSSPEEIVRMLANARCVVSVEGSQVTHAILACPAEASLIIIQPPDRFNAYHKTFTDGLGQRFGFTVAEAKSGGFVQSAKDLMATINLCERATPLH